MNNCNKIIKLYTFLIFQIKSYVILFSLKFSLSEKQEFSIAKLQKIVPRKHL